MRSLAACFAMILAACSSDDDGPEQPSSCSKGHRTGTYMLSFTEQSGSCGPIASSLVSFDPNANTTEGCKVDSETWSENDCKLERTVTCLGTYQAPTQWGGTGSFRNRGTAVTRQMTADGSRIDGVMTMHVETSGGTNCQGTYATSAVRQ